MVCMEGNGCEDGRGHSSNCEKTDSLGDEKGLDSTKSRSQRGKDLKEGHLPLFQKDNTKYHEILLG